MGQGMSCACSGYDHDFFAAVQGGDLRAVESFIRSDPSLVFRTTIYDGLSALHVAAANGRVEVLSMILDRSVNPDTVNRHKQTPLMLAVMHGKFACVQKLLEAGANILMFDSLNGRTCLHHAAYYGYADCLQVILSAAQSTTVADSWGFRRFVNVRDGNGATPLHLAARQTKPDCVHILLDNGALVSATTGGYCCPGSTALHLAARGGSLDCVRELLAWGANRLQRDSSGWLASLMESDSELCYICFDQVCTIKVQDCGHQMCAHCMLALCCHNKPSPTSLCSSSPTCPFCRSSISRLVIAKNRVKDEGDKDTISKLRRSRRSTNFSEGSSSLRGLSSVLGSCGKMTVGSGHISDSNDMADKPSDIGVHYMLPVRRDCRWVLRTQLCADPDIYLVTNSYWTVGVVLPSFVLGAMVM
ncbi:hypothetical protein C4D60_Mb06t34060 [Musa balbisiana]|uniref:RING-type E3 ubiquitin transferase n=1 Tax=Musa balbisiana TaxID=52838 RepID=A0A4S8ITZ6_MUSBA|nr:hypothetical protein C4D60_Mb06t34060 [Musa balbisiana]